MTKSDKQQCLGFYNQALENANQKSLFCQDKAYRTSRRVVLAYESQQIPSGKWRVLINARKGLGETIYWKAIKNFEHSIEFIKEMESKY
jgi:hypothetical protein